MRLLWGPPSMGLDFCLYQPICPRVESRRLGGFRNGIEC